MRESEILVWACKKIANHLNEDENAKLVQLAALAKIAKEFEERWDEAQRVLVGKRQDGKE